mgnify:FL=1
MEKLEKVETSKVSVVPLTEQWFVKADVSAKDKEHLLKSLHNLEVGRETTPCFKLYGSSSVEIVKRFLDSIDWNRIDVPDGWKEYEYDRLSKFGPQGGYRPWKEISELFHLYQSRLKPCYVVLESFNEFIKNYGTIFCQMLKVDDTLAELIATDKIQDRAAGCRRFALKKKDPEAQKVAIKDFKSGLADQFFMYTFSRYYKNKIRLFMPGPFASMLDQSRYVLPFLTAIQNDIKAKRASSSLVQHADKIGFDECFSIMSEEINNEISSSDISKLAFVYVQGDFEKMDTTTGTSQYEKLFIPAIAKSFRYSAKSKNYSELHKSMIKTTTMPIASPEGMMTGEHGTGSGMENTNIGEGCSNDYYQLNQIKKLYQYAKRKHLRIKVVSRRVNGDDSCLVIILYDPTPEKLAILKEIIQASAEDSAEECGFIINEKWRIDENFGLFCQNAFWYDVKERRIKWFYPSSLILNSILNPEHEYAKSEWDKDYRDIDIAEKLDNGRNLPYFTQLVKFVDNGMRFPLLGRNEQETSRILSKYERYRALQPEHERWNKLAYLSNMSNSPTLNLILKLRS